ncbi:TonB-dependent receptor [Dyadobacter pollutisoli]|uniref:TonB-dependent receptor n=1 Tax=Dyadobacter pollutisoli TaxID=2910158 RepID=A0A9E8NF18_9BACT|nr:TonB-dependent receptor [Dyadobacter pollutisoli]WAC13376.1 TonB-dependent receptor [Dyadobacter pollutisoli]
MKKRLTNYGTLAGMLAAFLLFFSGSPVFAQQSHGSVKGQVTGVNGEILPGASVFIKGTNIGSVTDLAGNYSLVNVPAGAQTVTINYMGFAPDEQSVGVIAGKTVFANAKLKSADLNLGEVTVTALLEGQRKALNQQRNSDNIKQVISADVMGRYPDLNVAESLQRLPGVTIGRNSSGEGATVQMRGTPGNFTNINVNGEQIMGTQEDGSRNAQLDVIPINVLSSMEVVKTLTPDLDGDAIAGVVNMKTPTAATLKSRFAVDLGAGYNNLRSNLNGIGNASWGKRFLASESSPNGKLGVIATGSYFRTKNGYDEIRAQVWEQNDYGKGAIYFPTDIRLLYVENQRTRIGTSATVDYNFSPTTNIIANFMYSTHNNELTRYRKRTRMQTARNVLGEDGVFTNSRGRGYNEIKAATEDNSNLNFNIQGETVVGKVKLDAGVFMNKSKFVNKSGIYNYITGNIPLSISDISTDYLSASGTDWKNDASLYTYNTVERDWWNTNGTNFTARLNASVPYQIGNNSAFFKAGVKVKRMHNERSRPDETIVTTYAGDAAAGKLTNFSGSLEVSDELLDGNTNFGLGVNKDKTINFLNDNLGTDLFPINVGATRNSIDSYYYDALETVSSAYLMNRIQFNKLMFLIGVRMEKTNVDYKGNIIQTDADGNWASTTPNQQTNDYLKVLPNVQFKYDIDKSSLVRAALTYGYSRPNFVDLVPGRLISILSETITDGNPQLQPAFSTNLDLMYEKYLDNLGIISGGFFYKKINKFQYNSVFALAGNEFDGAERYEGWRWFRTLNGESANVLGMELNVQANLTFLPGILKGISLMANYTYTHSNADAQFRKDLRLPGQADHTANGSLAFNHKKFTIQGNLNYNGAYTVLLGDQDATDVIRNQRIQIDANASYRITDKISFYVEAQNLTKAPQTDYFGERNRMYQKQFYSFWGRAGVKFRF